MSRTILVPLDGSSLAARAVPYASALARATGGRLVLMRAPLPAELRSRSEHRVDPTDELDTEAELARADGIEAEPYLYPVYAPYEVAGAILDAARDREADLIAMATHGRGGLGRWLYGSVADEVLRRSEVPVLLVSAACERPWPTGRPPRMLVPLDGSEQSEEVLRPAGEIAEALGAGLWLLQVIDLGFGNALAYNPKPDLLKASQYLDSIVARLRGAGASASSQVEVGPPASTIAAVADAQEMDLIAMATHGRGGIGRFVLGSAATEVLHRARVPLLLVSPAAARQQASRARAALTELPEGVPAPQIALYLSPQEVRLLQRELAKLADGRGEADEASTFARLLLARLDRAEAGAESADGGEAQRMARTSRA